MLKPTDPISLGRLIRRYPARIALTWFMTLGETAIFALLPLLMGRAIDGLLSGENTAFGRFCLALAVLLVLSALRRVVDTRAYGTMRADIGRIQALRPSGRPVSVRNAQILMGRELVDFLEQDAPESVTSLIRVLAAVAILASFDQLLAFVAIGAASLILVLFGASARRFFRLNSALNGQNEVQVQLLEQASRRPILAHFLRLRRSEVRLSDWESLIYALIFAVLLMMLAFNLWYTAVMLSLTAGAIFSIMSYSFEFVESAAQIPEALQKLIRLNEITTRINQAESGAD